MDNKKNLYSTSTSNNPDSEKIIKEFTEKVSDVIHEKFKSDGQILPALFFAKETDENKTRFGFVPGLEDLMGDDDKKNQLSQILKEIVKQVKPVCVCFVTEAWMVKNDSNNIIDKKGMYKSGAKRPSEHPDKIETVMLSFETHTKEMKIIYEIIRDNNAKPYLKLDEELNEIFEWTEKSDKKQIGRFSNLLNTTQSNTDKEESKIKVKIATSFEEAKGMMEEDAAIDGEQVEELFKLLGDMSRKMGIKDSTNSLPKGTRIIKVNSEQGDNTEDGIEGTVLASVSAPDTEELPDNLKNKNIKCAYLVKWDNFKYPVVVIDYKIKEI